MKVQIKNLPSIILIFLFLVDCSKKRSNYVAKFSLPAILLSQNSYENRNVTKTNITHGNSVDDNCLNATHRICYSLGVSSLNRLGIQKRKLYDAKKYCQKLFLEQDENDQLSYLKVNANKGTTVTFKNFSGVPVTLFAGIKSHTPIIIIYKQFRDCSDKKNPFDVRSSNYQTTEGVDYIITGTTSVTARKITFKKDSTYLVVMVDPGKGLQESDINALPFNKTDNNRYPTVQITDPGITSLQ